MTLKDYWAQALPVQSAHRPATSPQESSQGSGAPSIYQQRFDKPSPSVSEKSDKAPATAGGWIQDLIREKSRKYDVPESLIQSIVQAESGFDPNAVSPAGAKGLMQLMPGTAKDLGVSNVFDPAQNLEGGVRYFRQMLDRFDHNVTYALAAYNAGPGNVAKYQGVPPYRETQNYVKKILKNYENA